jgi:microcystin-dependent protein
MVYIGHYTPLQIFPDNVRDDIVPNPPQTTFVLSQTVPGGYEGNVLVIRRKFEISSVIEGTVELEFVAGTNQIVCNNPETAQILSQIKLGEAILIDGASNSENNGVFIVTDVSFNISSITFTVQTILVNETGTAVNVRRGKDGYWEILKPEVDYTIQGVGTNYNREITFSEILEEADQCYVIHRGSATYNLVPSNNSVGPDQLSHNLRNFTVDRFEGDGLETDFILTQEPVNSKAILVTVDGEILDGNDPLAPPFPFVGEWEIIEPDILRFHVAPGVGVKIRVLHLGFSTVSRRAAISDGQIGVVAPASVTELELANNSVTNPKLATNSVSASKIQNNAVNHNKILLDNEQPLRASRTDASIGGLIKMNSLNHTILENNSLVGVQINNIQKINFVAQAVEPETNNDVDLGTALKKFKNLNLAGGASIAGNTVIEGDLNVLGKINGLQTVPVGTIMMTGRASAPAGYLLCQGQEISRSGIYEDLFNAIGIQYGGGNGTTTFNIPDLQQRFPLGRTTSVGQPASTLGAVGGVINHTHSFSHTHDVNVNGSLPNHTHVCPAGVLTGVNEHNHSIAHVHDISHNHVVPRHQHTEYSLSTTVGGAHTHTLPRAKLREALSGTTPIDRIRVTGQAGAQPAVTTEVNSGGSDHSHTIATGGRVGRTGTTVLDTAEVLGTFTYAGAPSGAVAGVLTTSRTDIPNMNNLPIKTGTTTTSGPSSDSNVLISGSTGNPTTNPVINSTGGTTSQSTTVSGDANPPYIVVNFMIKI